MQARELLAPTNATIPEPVHIGEAKKAWNELYKKASNIIEQSTTLFPEDDGPEVEREVGHELKIASRLLSYPYEVTVDEEGSPPSEAERRIRNLELRLENNRLQSLQLYKDILCSEDKAFGFGNCEISSRIAIPELGSRRSAAAAGSSTVPKRGQKKRHIKTASTNTQTDDLPLILTFSLHPCTYRQSSRHQSFEVYSNEKLSVVCDNLSCNIGNFYEYYKSKKGDLAFPPSRPDLPSESERTGQGALLLVEGALFTNTQYGVDLSASIRSRIGTLSEGFDGKDQLVVKIMQNSSFEDLCIIIEKPYLLVHVDGKCEHQIVFHQIRLAHPYDRLPHQPWMLPFVEGIREFAYNRKKTRKCRICNAPRARWLVTNHILLPENPCSLCHDCLILFHYDENSRLTILHPDDSPRLLPYFYE